MKLSIVHTGKQHPENIVDKWSCIKIEGMYCIDIIFPSVASKEDIESITRLLWASSDLLEALQELTQAGDIDHYITSYNKAKQAIQKATL
jgi:hypothetical protein